MTKTKRAVYFYSHSTPVSFIRRMDALSPKEKFDPEKETPVGYLVTMDAPGKIVARQFKVYGYPIYAESPEELQEKIRKELES